MQRRLYHCFKDCCHKGHVNVIGDHASPLWIFKTPNFELFGEYFEMMYDGFTSNGMKKQVAKRSITYCAEELLLACYQFDRNDKGHEIYSKFKKSFPNDIKLSKNYSDYMRQLLKENLSQMNRDSIAIEISKYLEYGYSLIAVGKTEDGNGLLRFSELIFRQALSQGIYKVDDIKILREKVFLSVLESVPINHKSNLKRWKQVDALKGSGK